MKWYYFLDISGDLLRVDPRMVKISPDHYKNGYINHWLVDTKKRGDLWKFCIAAIACGAKEKDIMQLAIGWNLTNAEAQPFARSMGVQLTMQVSHGPDVWIASFSDHKSEEEGRGPSALHALSALAKAGALRATLDRKKN